MALQRRHSWGGQEQRLSRMGGWVMALQLQRSWGASKSNACIEWVVGSWHSSCSTLGERARAMPTAPLIPAKDRKTASVGLDFKPNLLRIGYTDPTWTTRMTMTNRYMTNSQNHSLLAEKEISVSATSLAKMDPHTTPPKEKSSVLSKSRNQPLVCWSKNLIYAQMDLVRRPSKRRLKER